MKLSDSDLTRLAATAVMGWIVENSRGGQYYNDPSSDINHPWVRDWSPLTDWRAAGEIVDEMRADGWHCLTMAVSGGENLCDYYRRADDKRKTNDPRETMPRAITIAALLALGAVTQDQV